MQWPLAVGYLIAAAACAATMVAAVRSAPPDTRMRQAAGWGGLAATLLALGLNKLMGLSVWANLAGGRFVLVHGWRPERRAVQIPLTLVAIAVGVGCVFSIWRLYRKSGLFFLLAVEGTVFELFYLPIRMLSLHEVDRVLGRHLGSATVGWLIEMAGILWILFACLPAA